MAKACSICTSGHREEAERALVAGVSYRQIEQRFGLARSALQRHKADHLMPHLLAAKEAEDLAGATEVIRELERITERAQLLYDACDRYLRDADDPSRYDIGPRDHEVTVTYYERDDGSDGGRRRPRKELLSSLLDRLERDHGIRVVRESIRIADPRDLIIKTMVALKGNLELLSKLTGELDERPQVTVLTSPEWLELRSQLFEALAPYPDARAAAANRLRLMDGGRAS